MRDKMSKFTEGVNCWLESASAEILSSFNNTLSHTLIGIEHEEEDIMQEYNQVIISWDLPDTEEDTTKSCLGRDKYISMKLGLSRGEDRAIKHMTVKRRAVDVKGKPIG